MIHSLFSSSLEKERKKMEAKIPKETCPDCKGRGLLNFSEYAYTPYSHEDSISNMCYRCKGKGYVYKSGHKIIHHFKQ